MKLIEIIESSAFTVADDEFPGIIAAISGPYVTLWIEDRDGYQAIDGVNPLHHAEEGENGLYGQDAARLYDYALQALRFETPAQLESEEVTT